MATERPSGLKQRSYLIGGDEINWLETAAGKTKLEALRCLKRTQSVVPEEE